MDLTCVDSEESVGRALAAQLGFPVPDRAPHLARRPAHPRDRRQLRARPRRAAAEAVAALLSSCASPSVVATSRSPLDLPGESLVVLGPLPIPRHADASASPAVQLFLERAADAGTTVPESSLPTVVELCRALDGVPLAIELAAARTRVLSPAQVLAALDDLGALDRGGRRGADRHASLRGTIAWSYDQLPAAAQRLFERTAVLSGRFSLATAHALQPADASTEADTFRDLEQLVQVSLVVTEADDGRTWFRLLHPIRRFAHERLVARGDDVDARARFVRHTVGVALEVAVEARGGWDGNVLGDLVARSGELVAALRHTLDLDDRASAFILLAVLWGVVHQAPVEDVRAAGEEALRRWPDVRARGWADAAATVRAAATSPATRRAPSSSRSTALEVRGPLGAGGVHPATRARPCAARPGRPLRRRPGLRAGGGGGRGAWLRTLPARARHCSAPPR